MPVAKLQHLLIENKDLRNTEPPKMVETAPPNREFGLGQSIRFSNQSITTETIFPDLRSQVSQVVDL
jgi:hypothetical protein